MQLIYIGHIESLRIRTDGSEAQPQLLHYSRYNTKRKHKSSSLITLKRDWHDAKQNKISVPFPCHVSISNDTLKDKTYTT